MSNAVSTTGILVQRAPTGSPTSFVTIGELIKVSSPGFSRNKIETSTHNDGTESYILGILRQSDGAFSINYLAADTMHALCVSDIQGNTRAIWKFLLPSGVSFTAAGRVQTFKIVDASVDGAQQADVVICWAAPVVQA